VPLLFSLPADLNTAQNSLLTRSYKLPCSSKSSATLKTQQSCSSSWLRYACALTSSELFAAADNSAHRRDTHTHRYKPGYAYTDTSCFLQGCMLYKGPCALSYS
jgi:hypothetical protein